MNDSTSSPQQESGADPDRIEEVRGKGNWGPGLPIGIALGAGIGAAMGNVGLGVAIGLAIGVGIGSLGGSRERKA